jgi:hypothetical protein
VTYLNYFRSSRRTKYAKLVPNLARTRGGEDARRRAEGVFWTANLFWGERNSRPRFTDDTDASVRAPARFRFGCDLYVLAKRSQEAHQPIAGEVGQARVEQRRDFRLVDAHERRRGNLRPPVTFDDLPGYDWQAAPWLARPRVRRSPDRRTRCRCSPLPECRGVSKRQP